LFLELLEDRCLPTGGLSLHQSLVTQLYQDVLGRLPDAPGLAYWSAALDQGATRSEVAGQLIQTPEALARVLDDLYQANLGRQADSAGSAAFLPLLARGQQDQVEAQIIGSQEYSAHHQINGLTDYLAHLYADVLGRPADSTALAYFSKSQFDGDHTAIALAVLQSTEGRRDRVQQNYLRYLERDPDVTGAAYWADSFAQYADSLTLAQALLGSDEYFNSPHANNDAVETAVGTPAVFNVAANDIRLFGRAYEVALVQNPAHGSAAVREDGSIIYVPDAGFSGVDVLAYRLQTAAGTSSLGIVTVNVLG
jgi:Bacterial Ig domain/Domain of unknown function (DUF4214)